MQSTCVRHTTGQVWLGRCVLRNACHPPRPFVPMLTRLSSLTPGLWSWLWGVQRAAPDQNDRVEDGPAPEAQQQPATREPVAADKSDNDNDDDNATSPHRPSPTQPEPDPGHEPELEKSAVCDDRKVFLQSCCLRLAWKWTAEGSQRLRLTFRSLPPFLSIGSARFGSKGC